MTKAKTKPSARSARGKKAQPASPVTSGRIQIAFEVQPDLVARIDRVASANMLRRAAVARMLCVEGLRSWESRGGQATELGHERP